MRVMGGRRKWLVALTVFMAVFLFTFLTAKFKNNIDVEAANLANFDPGYIISDYQMGNYNSMSEAEIWNFLKQKGNCNDTRIWQTGNNLGYLSESAPYSWHVSDGHYVCLADENFSGESAAHIIWQAAQDYRINPQVLIVLLQKEQGLITDSFPNSVQYRSATGYGCPDTAACSSRYYGFKNQVRNAAALFRTVLDGGWTNYPLGNNYIQYNPNSGCGGSWVNIRSLATSALYRYTPYQPNASALAAGYGAGDSCGAYGNRNFYSYFEDWFGNSFGGGVYEPFATPRYLRLKRNTDRINPFAGSYYDTLESGTILKYTSKVYIDGKGYYRTEWATNNNVDAAVPSDAVEEVDEKYIAFDEPRYLRLSRDVERVNPYTGCYYDTLKAGVILKFTSKIYIHNKWYFRTEWATDGDIDAAIMEGATVEVNEEYEKIQPKYMILTRDIDRVNPYTEVSFDKLGAGMIREYTSRIFIHGKWYYRTAWATDNDINAAIPESVLMKMEEKYEPFINPRYLRLKYDVNRVNPYTGEYYDSLRKGTILMFTSKIYVWGNGYYRTEWMTDRNIDAGVPSWLVEEVWEKFEPFITPRKLRIKYKIDKINPYTKVHYDMVSAGDILNFSTKIFIDGKAYYRTTEDTIHNRDIAVPAEVTEEVR